MVDQSTKKALFPKIPKNQNHLESTWFKILHDFHWTSGVYPVGFNRRRVGWKWHVLGDVDVSGVQPRCEPLRPVRRAGDSWVSGIKHGRTKKMQSLEHSDSLGIGMNSRLAVMVNTTKLRSAGFACIVEQFGYIHVWRVKPRSQMARTC